MPRWWHCTWACVHDSVAARSNVAGSPYLSASATAASREEATSVENTRRALSVGASRTRRLRLKMGSSTEPAVLDSGRPSMTAIGVRIGRRRGQHELGVGRHLDLSGPRPEVRDRDAAHLGVVFRRNEHLERGGDRAVTPMKLGALFEERRLVGVWFDAGGLVPGRPDRP